MSSSLPKIVIALTHNHDAWIVGSAADPDNKTPRDYDVQVPFSEWGKAAHLIPAHSRVNTFGGWKCTSEGVEIDVWPGELGWLLQRPKCNWAWHPASGIRVQKRLIVSSPAKTTRSV